MHFWLLILFSVLLQIVLIPIIHADIGSISEVRGNGEVTRVDTTDKLLAELALDIFSNDDVRTGNGRMAIRFIDDTEIKLTEHSKVIIDTFVFDPNPAKSQLALSFIKGTGRFISSKTKRKIPNKNVKIKANGAFVGIRGTDFTITSDEIGRTMVILLPNPDGTASGEITVTTFAGTVVMNKPFQATVVTVAEQMPTRPVTLTNMTLDFIDNLLIVNPPEETERAVEEQNTQANNILDIDLLEETELEKDYLDEDELENINRLDIDLLNIDFLTDLLDVIETNVNKQAEVNVIEGVEIEGIKPPFDPTTQTFTFVEGSMLTIFRQVENTIDLQLDKDGAYNISILSAGQQIEATINGGGESEIFINQSN
jgi:hypothetical protein|tara:strand:+ start:1398 stop:2504 length:1107 start_codon:yes stop_codon:yes gene_type:complete